MPAIKRISLFAALAIIPLSGADPALQRLEREMERLARNAGMTMGASAVHIETGRRVALAGSDRFPMASTYKVPIAVQLLTRVDEGELRLDEMITLAISDLHPGSGTLSDLFAQPGLALSVRNLLELMLLISDNSATDICLRLAGGPEQVTARMRSLGISGINVNRPTLGLIADWAGVKLPSDSPYSADLFRKLHREITADEAKGASERFNADPRDTSTPDSMADLLARIHRKNVLKPASSDLLLDILRRCRTGDARIKGLLPANTEVKHKTGTIGGTTNDVGIITLPQDAGHVALAVFIKSSDRESAERERAIAEVGRAVHDFFLFHPSASQ